MSKQTSNVGEQLAFSFYDDTLTEAERTKLSHARSVDGLDEEIALLRVRLHRLFKEKPSEDELSRLELLIKGLGMLVKLVSVRYKLSPAARDNLADHLSKVINEISSAFITEGS